MRLLVACVADDACKLDRRRLAADGRGYGIGQWIGARELLRLLRRLADHKQQWSPHGNLVFG
jgi:hypothetical protein